jgi:hypothetical protein
MEVEFACRDCGKSNQIELSTEIRITCAGCGKDYGSLSDFTDENDRVTRCAICGCRDLYIQKDFNRKIGCAIVLIGAILAPFTKLISLFVCALIDLILYRALPMISVCYKCKSIYRDFPANQEHAPFNLGINDRYRNV